MDSNQVQLIALQDFSHSVGFVEAGHEFGASKTYAKSLIAEGIARLKGDHIASSSVVRKHASKADKWPGSKVVIIASGPSLTPEDVGLVREWREAQTEECRRVIVINTTFKIAPWADALYAADASWWKMYEEETAQAFKGERWTQSEPTSKKIQGVKLVACERRPGLSKIYGVIHNGGNSAYQAMGLAAMFGARKQVLLAFDMQRTDKKSHWHGDHPRPLRQTSQPTLDNFARAFGPLSKDMKEAGIEVVNASRETALGCFERKPLEEALA